MENVERKKYIKKSIYPRSLYQLPRSNQGVQYSKMITQEKIITCSEVTILEDATESYYS